MKKILTILCVAILSFQATAQDDFNERWTAAYNLVSDKKYSEALTAFEPILVENPSLADTHVQMSWCYLFTGKMEEAMLHSQSAYQIDPLNASVYAINSYLMYIAKQNEAGKVYLDNAVWLLPNDDDLKYLDKDIVEMKEAGFDVSVLEAAMAGVSDGINTRNRDWALVMDKFTEGLEKLNNSDFDGSKVTFKEIFGIFDKVPEGQKRLVFNVTYLISTHYYNVSDSTNYMPLLSKTFDYMSENSKTSSGILLHMVTLLGEHYYNTGQYAKSFEFVSKGLEYLTALNRYNFLGYNKAAFLSQYSMSANAVGNMTEARDAASLVTEISYSGFDEWFQTNGWLYLAQAWGQDASKQMEYYQKAYDMASENGFEDLQDIAAEGLN